MLGGYVRYETDLKLQQSDRNRLHLGYKEQQKQRWDSGAVLLFGERDRDLNSGQEVMEEMHLRHVFEINFRTARCRLASHETTDAIRGYWTASTASTPKENPEYDARNTQ